MSDDSCSPVLKALSDETRWRIVRALLDEERAKVTELAARLSVSQPNISKHLRVLRNAGVVLAEKEGTTVWCQVTPDFRRRLRGGELALDLGCCTFRFDQPMRN